MLTRHALCAVIAAVGVTSAARAVVVEFNESGLPSNTILTFPPRPPEFTALGLEISGAARLNQSTVNLNAGTDNWGIQNVGATSFDPLIFTFLTPVSNLRIFWATVNSNVFTATAFDAGNNAVAAFTTPQGVGTTGGDFTFSNVGEITRVTINGPYFTAFIGRLEYIQVPAPGAAALAALSLGAAGLRRRR